MTLQAAVEGLGPLLDTDPQQLEAMFRVNVFAPLALIQAFAEALIQSKGCIVNIGSVGVSGLPFHGIYASSKVHHDTKTLRANADSLVGRVSDSE